MASFWNIIRFVIFVGIATALPGFGTSPAVAQNAVCDSLEVHFKVGEYIIDHTFSNNCCLDSLVSLLNDPRIEEITKIYISGYSSPEGSIKFNRYLSRKRAESVLQYLRGHLNVPDSVVSLSFSANDWKGFRSLVASDPDVPGRDEVLRVIDHGLSSGEMAHTDILSLLKNVGNGESYGYIKRNIFPDLRRARLVVEYLYSCGLLSSQFAMADLSGSTTAPAPECTSVVSMSDRGEMAESSVKSITPPHYLSKNQPVI